MAHLHAVAEGIRFKANIPIERDDVRLDQRVVHGVRMEGSGSFERMLQDQPGIVSRRSAIIPEIVAPVSSSLCPNRSSHGSPRQ